MNDQIIIKVQHKNRDKFIEFHDKLGDFIAEFITEHDKRDDIMNVKTSYTVGEKE